MGLVLPLLLEIDNHDLLLLSSQCLFRLLCITGLGSESKLAARFWEERCLLEFVSLGCKVFSGVLIREFILDRFGCNVSFSILVSCRHLFGGRSRNESPHLIRIELICS